MGQHRVTKIENAFDSKQHELDDANRLIDEQNKTMEEYKKSISLLQANLAESKSDQSDLINALQTEWEHTKEEVIRYKSKCRQLQQEKDEIIAQNMTIQQQMDHHHQHSHNNEENAEMIVLVHDLQRRLQQKEDEVASQEMLMKQLMEQQKAFQKRNKTLVGRLKAIKKRGGNMQIDEGFNQMNDTHAYYQQQQQQQQQVPDSVIIEMKSLYDHYVRNPVLQSAELIHQIRIKSASIMDHHHNHHSNNYSYTVPRFNSMQINSASTLLMIFEDILLQRLNAIKSENAKQRQILSLKEEY